MRTMMIKKKNGEERVPLHRAAKNFGTLLLHHHTCSRAATSPITPTKILNTHCKAAAAISTCFDFCLSLDWRSVHAAIFSQFPASQALLPYWLAPTRASKTCQVLHTVALGPSDVR
jgi:hypothetical protein